MQGQEAEFVRRTVPEGVSGSCRLCSVRELCILRSLAASPRRLPQRTRVFQRGQPVLDLGDSLGVVRSGSVKSSLVTSDGREHIVALHLPGDPLGLDRWAAAARSGPAQALETTSVCTVATAQVEHLAAESRMTTRALFRIFAQEIATERTTLLMLGSGRAMQRMAALALRVSRRQRARGLSQRRFNLTLSRQELGNYLGLAMETVSRLLSKLQVEGVLHVDRQAIEVLDLERLQHLAGETPVTLQAHRALRT